MSTDTIVRDVARRSCERITRRTIKCLQGMGDYLLSGDGDLKNTWDEICVQQQYEKSVVWDFYDETVRAFVEGDVEELSPIEREAIWRQTAQGEEWECDPDARGDAPVFDEDIVNYLLESYIYSRACDWSNERIRTFLARSEMD